MTVEQKPVILVVEDDESLFRLVRFHLEREGFEVRHANDGEKALLEFERPDLPDLVILDVMLPYHNGYDLLANLRSRQGWVNVPVIMLSSSDRENEVVRGLSSGANDFLAKPFRPAEVVARIRNLLDIAAKAKQ
jgi:DNA-binding response OmpR family regulator